MGKGAYNTNNGINNIEGIAASADTEFGGGLTPNNADNSGSLKYVRIEFAGYVYGTNQEINGLTFGAVGSGTTIDYVQVSHSNDDSFEWFGGAVNCKHLVAFRGLDDDFDTDNGYSGKVQYCLAVRDPNIADAPAVSTSEGFESDNNAAGDNATPFTTAIFSNCTMIGPAYRTTLPNGGTMPTGAYKRAARLRKNTKLSIYNSIFMDYVEGLHIDSSGSALNGAAELNALNGELQFKNNILAGITTATKIVQVSTTNNNANFNIANWFNASNNTGLATPITNAGILVLPYNTADGSIYTGLDYRPGSSSIAATGSSFTFLGTETFNAAANASLKSYPNPFSTSFRLSFESTSTEEVSLNAYDLTGRVVESHLLSYNDVNNQEFGSNYQSGMYIIVLKQGEISKSFRVIKR